MGVADRHYMRDEYHPPLVTTRLIIVLIVVFVIQSLLLFYNRINLTAEFGLSVRGVSQGKVWQLLTFQFLHASPWPWHVLFNCLGLYFFGRRVEETLGPRRFLQVYFLSGFGGGLLHVLLTFLLPQHPDFSVVGASAGVCGIIAIFCSLHPMEELTTWIYFFPITVRARVFLMFLGGLSLFGALVPFGQVAHAAHLGGILVGLIYIRWRHTLRETFSRWFPWLARSRGRPFMPGSLAKSLPWKRGRVKTDVFISKEVDPILDKISAQGIDSLTERERQILDAARKKMR